MVLDGLPDALYRDIAAMFYMPDSYNNPHGADPTDAVAAHIAFEKADALVAERKRRNEEWER